MGKARVQKIAAVAGAIVCTAVFGACGAGKATALGVPKAVEPLSYEENYGGDFKAFKQKEQTFSAAFAANAYQSYEKEENFAVSPVSVFMALSLAAECAGGATREELLSALGVSYEELQAHFSTLYRSLCVEEKEQGKTTNVVDITNSVWVNENTPVNQACIDALSDNYYAYSYHADFLNDNANANKAVRSFVKEKTHGLIDKNFQLSGETLFALVNTLYLKAIWNTDGNDLPFTNKEYAFTAKDGTVTNRKLLQGYYKTGKVYQGENYSTFYTETNGGYKIKFLLPDEGYSVSDIFTKENVAEANGIVNYDGIDEENDTVYYTRCLFPAYKCKYDGDLKPVLRNYFGIERFFKDPGKYSDACDFSALSPEECYCESVKHAVDLTVNEKGIEGAAVTIIGMNGATSAPPRKEVYSDFVLDRAFGFVITDRYNVTLFSGVVHNI